MQDSLASSLTEREAQVLALAADGLTNPEIGRRLGITRYTVSNLLTRVYRKTGSNDTRSGQLQPRIKAINWWRDHRWMFLNPSDE